MVFRGKKSYVETHMLLFFAWLLFIFYSLVTFDHIGWFAVPWIRPFGFALLATAWLVWVLLLFQYLKSVQWIRTLATNLEVDPNRQSYQIIRRKWSRVTMQVFLITFLVTAYLGLDVMRMMGKDIPPQPWISMGVWVVWFHSLLWFSLSWSRDQRLKKHLEREMQIEDAEASMQDTP